MRNHALTSLEKVLLTLRFLATEKMGMTWESPSLVCLRPYPAPSAAFPPREKCGDSINFLMPFDKIRNVFFKIVWFPESVGTKDDTHVQIIAPKYIENEFVNSCQVVFNTQYKLIDIAAK